MIELRQLALLLAALLPGAPLAASACGTTGVAVQVLGSGGPELTGSRASSAYLVWIDGAARVLVDFGGGAALRFGQSGARIEDLDAIALSHLHADHSADLPALLKAAWFSERTRDLSLFGPSGDGAFPGLRAFLNALFDDTRGAWRYLGDHLAPGGGRPRLEPIEIAAPGHDSALRLGPDLTLRARSVAHGPVPALAWRIGAGRHIIVFSGDTSARGPGLAQLAAGADLLVAHNAVPEGASGVARRLHMPPSLIGESAAQAGVGRVILSHRMRRTLGREAETRARIAERYAGPVDFADDLDCFALD